MGLRRFGSRPLESVVSLAAAVTGCYPLMKSGASDGAPLLAAARWFVSSLREETFRLLESFSDRVLQLRFGCSRYLANKKGSPAVSSQITFPAVVIPLCVVLFWLKSSDGFCIKLESLQNEVCCANPRVSRMHSQAKSFSQNRQQL